MSGSYSSGTYYENYVFTGTFEDKISAPVDQATVSIKNFEGSMQDAQSVITGATEAIGASFDKLTARARAEPFNAWQRSIDPLGAKLRQQEGLLAAVTARMNEGGASAQKYGALYAPVSANVANLTKQHDVLLKNLGQVDGVSRNAAQGIRFMSTQWIDVVQQLAVGQNPLQVLLQQGGQVYQIAKMNGVGWKDVGIAVAGFFSAIAPMAALVAPIAAVGAAALALGTRFSAVREETKELERAIVTFGQSGNVTTTELRGYIKQLEDIGVAAKDATAATTALSRNRDLTAGQRQQIISLTGTIQPSSGMNVPEFSKQAEAAVTGHADAIKQLNSALNLLTPAEYSQVQALLAHNEAAKAGEIVLGALLQRQIEMRRDGLEPSISTIRQMTNAWRSLMDTLGDTGPIKAMAGGWSIIFRDLARDLGAISVESLTRQLLDAQKQLREAKAAEEKGFAITLPVQPGSAAVQSKVDDLQRQIDELTKRGIVGSKLYAPSDVARITAGPVIGAPGGGSPLAGSAEQGISTKFAEAEKLADEAAAASKSLLANQIADLTEKHGKFLAAQKATNTSTEAGAADFKMYGDAAEATALKLDKLKDAAQELVDKTLAEAQMTDLLTASLSQGGAVVNQMTAAIKALDQARGLAFANDQARQAFLNQQTAANLADVDAKNKQKLVNQSLADQDTAEQLRLEETLTIKGKDQAARKAAVEQLKAEQDMRRQLSNTNIAEADQRRQSVADLGKQREATKLASEAESLANKSKTFQVGELNKKIAEMTAEQQKADRTTADGKQTFDFWANGIRGAREEIARLSKESTGAAQKIENLMDTFARMAERTNLEADRLEALTKAADEGGAAYNRLAASIKAQDEILQKDTRKLTADQIAGIKESLTQANLRVIEDQKRQQMNQSAVSNENTIAQLQLETSLIGENVVVRNTAIETLKAEQEIKRSGLSIDDAAAQRLLASIANMEAIREQNRLAQASFAELGSFVDNTFSQIGQAIADAFMSGQGKAVNFGNVVKSVMASVVQEFIKLAFVNPLTNMFNLGEQKPTLSSVLDVLGGGGTKTDKQAAMVQATEENSATLRSVADAIANDNRASISDYADPTQNAIRVVNVTPQEIPSVFLGATEARGQGVVQLASADDLALQHMKSGDLGGIRYKPAEPQPWLTPEQQDYFIQMITKPKEEKTASLEGPFIGYTSVEPIQPRYVGPSNVYTQGTSGGGYVDTGTWDDVLGMARLGASVSQMAGSAGGGGGGGGLGTLMQGIGLLRNGGWLLNSLGLTGPNSMFSGLGDMLNIGGIFGKGGLGNIFSGGGLFGSTGPIAGFLNMGIGGTSIVEAALAANTPASVFGMAGGGLDASLLTGVTPATGLFGGASIGSLLGGVGAGFGIGSFAGGLLQRSLGKTGPGPMIGAGVGALGGLGAGVAAGAAAGSVVPVIGTIIGAIIGGLAGGAIGPKPPSPYQASFLSIGPNGEVVADPRLTGNQISPSNYQMMANQAGEMNVRMSSLGVRLGSQQGITTQGGQLVPQGALGFFGTAKNAAGFAGQNLMDVFPNLRFQAGTNMDPKTQEVMNRNLERSFKDFDELGAMVNKVRTFVEQTVPTLLKFGDAQGSLNQALVNIDETFNPAIKTAQELAYSEAELTSKRTAAIEKAKQEAWAPFATIQQELASRFATAQAAISGDATQQLNAQLQAFDVQAQAQRKQLTDQLVATYGEAAKQADFYAAMMTQLEQTLGQERLAVQKQANEAIKQEEKQRMDQARSTATSLIQSITQYTKSLQFGAQSPLSPTAQFEAAQRDWSQNLSKLFPSANDNKQTFADVVAKTVGGAGITGQSLTDLVNQFTKDIGASPQTAEALQGLTGYADALLNAARNVYGSGEGYAQIFRQVSDALEKVGSIPEDTLTASFYALEVRTQTDSLLAALADLKSEVAALRAQVASGSAMPARLAA